MTILSRLTLIPITLFFTFILVLPVLAEEESKYGEWQTSDDRLENMIDDLDQVIKEGTRSRAAHPGFLQDLNRIIDQYRIPTRTTFFSDDFADNNFTDNPSWTVRNGVFSVDRFGALYSSIPVRKPATEKDTEPETEGDRNLRILLGVLNEITKDGSEQQGQGDQTAATITSAATIPNSFTLQYSFKSNSTWGSTGIGVIVGEDPLSGYHLVYRPSPGEDRPLQLIKYRYGNPYIIDEVLENSPDLDDGLEHTAKLVRSANGDMVVTIDNVEVMRTADFSNRDEFSGIAIVNNGGSYSYDNIEFYTEQ